MAGLIDLRKRDPMEYAKEIWNASLEGKDISIGGGNILTSTFAIYAVYSNRGTHPVQFKLYPNKEEAEKAAERETCQVFEQNRRKILAKLLLHDEGAYATVRATDSVLDRLSSQTKYWCASVTDRSFSGETVATIREKRRVAELRTDVPSVCRYLVLKLPYRTVSTIMNFEDEWIWEGYGSQVGGDWKLKRNELQLFVRFFFAKRALHEEAVRQHEERTGVKRVYEKEEEKADSERPETSAKKYELSLAMNNVEANPRVRRILKEMREVEAEAFKLPLFVKYLASQLEAYRVRPILWQSQS